jgi:hypothetical protein
MHVHRQITSSLEREPKFTFVTEEDVPQWGQDPIFNLQFNKPVWAALACVYVCWSVWVVAIVARHNPQNNKQILHLSF